MSITTLRNDLEEIRALIESNQAKQALDKLNLALADLDQEKPQAQSSNGHTDLLPTVEQQSQQDEQEFYLDAQDAVRWLGIASEAELRNLVLSQDLKHKFNGDVMFVEYSELERIEQSDAVRALREAKRAVDKSIALALCNGHLIEEGEEEPYLPPRAVCVWLGIDEDDEATPRFLARRQEVKYKRDGDLILIPLSELERIDNSRLIQDLRASHQVEEQIAALWMPVDRSPMQKERDELEAVCSKHVPCAA